MPCVDCEHGWRTAERWYYILIFLFQSTIAINQSPTLREKAILLVKLMQNIDKRFSDDHELNSQFLELVNFIYRFVLMSLFYHIHLYVPDTLLMDTILTVRDETLSGSELTAKLEPAFMSGLRCSQVSIRQKFFEVFDNSMKHRIYDRLLYIVCSQNWETMVSHFWIKQCLEVRRHGVSML